MKPFTKRDKKRLIRVCEIVRSRLGLGGLRFSFAFRARDGYKTAQYLCYHWGWRLDIVFYDVFFKKSLEEQLEIIVHEHVHAMTAPAVSCAYRQYNALSKSQYDKLSAAIDTADEIMTDHATRPLLELLMPHIKKVL